MVVVFNKDVQASLKDYIDSLKDYPISIERAIEKYDNMVNALVALGNSLNTPPICTNKDLGQTFNNRGVLVNKNLRRFNYKDESGFQWAFACNYDYDNDTIKITKMMAAKHIKEDKSRCLFQILELIEKIK